ncbi:hypothetical protein JRO89_XS01G0141600 [Xanthoceras sorbifolium]|uniref:HMG box domain-containing protein n=1 Tax=Xanthoceras sorbifolium TaxID=99658 RepID=A0ABQ8IJ72_9ROSI|nr:hypothetical protein JRO89_XS01G0141600 [Xanthoceras sorbifolium]
MRGPRVVAIAQKKPDAEIMKKRKAENKTTKEKASKKTASRKDSDAPKRAPTAFFLFMEDFRKSFKENCADNKSVSAVGKAGGEKWKSMSEAEKAAYIKIADKRKAEYQEAFEAYKKKLNGDGVYEKPENSEKSEKSTTEVHDDDDQEASS